MFGADGREAIYIEFGNMRGLIVKKKKELVCLSLSKEERFQIRGMTMVVKLTAINFLLNDLPAVG